MLAAHVQATQGPHAFTFTSAYFARYALAWVCSFKLDLYAPPLPCDPRPSRPSRYDMQLAMEGAAGHAVATHRLRAIQRPPSTVQALHTSRGACAQPPARRSPSSAEYIEDITPLLHRMRVVDARARYKIGRRIASAVSMMPARPARERAGKRLSDALSDDGASLELASLRCRAHALAGAMSNAFMELGHLLEARRERLDAMLGTLGDGRHVRHREPDIVCIYEAFAAVLSAVRMRAQGDCAPDEAHRTLMWFVSNPRAFAFIQPTFPRVVAAVYSLVLRVGEPVKYVREHMHELKRSGIDLVCLAATNRGAPERAALSALVALRRGIVVKEAVVRRIIRDLTHMRSWILADELAEHLLARGSAEPATLRVLAMLAAHQGNTAEFARRIRLVRAGGEDEITDAFILQAQLRCAAATGDLALFNELLLQRGHVAWDVATGKAPPPKNFPSTFVASAMLHILARTDETAAGDIYQGVLERDMLDESVCVEYARIGAHAGDVDLVRNVIDDAEDRGVALSPRLVRMLATAFMHCNDADGVARAIRSYALSGGRPDIRLYTVLLNAYVETGRWSAALGAFRWLLRQRSASLYPDTAVYNTILKAYVLRGVSERTVLELLYKMCTAGIRPDGRTFALVLQRSCNAGHISLAEEIFRLLSESLRKHGGPTVYHYTLMIHGFLRVGNTQRAGKYHEAMRSRGIAPTPVTLGILIREYTRNPAYPVEDALRFAAQFVDPLNVDRTSEYVIIPLVQAYVDRGEYDKAHEMLAELVNSHVRMSGVSLAVLLRTYCHAGNTAGLFHAYDLVYRYVVNQCAVTELPGQPPSTDGPRALLCLPLSVVIDYASLSGMHSIIPELWSRAQRDGFSFDPRNWNSLCAAYARAGHLREALRVIEDVLHEPHGLLLGSVSPEARRTEREYSHDPVHEADRSSDGPLGPVAPAAVRDTARRARRDPTIDPEALSTLPHASDDPASVDAFFLETADEVLSPRYMWIASAATLHAVHDAIERAQHSAPHSAHPSSRDAPAGTAALASKHAPRFAHGEISSLLQEFPTAAARLGEFRQWARERAKSNA